MAKKELFNFGDNELNVDSLIKNITTNLQSYLDYYSDSIPDAKAFNEKVNYIKESIKNGNITIDKDNKYHDTKGMINDNDLLMQYALGYVNLIANEQSKKERSLTKSEIAKLEEDKKRKKEELARQKAQQEYIEQTKKPDFEPLDGWSVARAFAHSFNQNGLIPYNLLQQLVTTDKNGNSVYTDLHNLLDKNFDLVSKQLLLFNNTEPYINSINLFKLALKDGDLSPQDKFLGMELGFLSSELDKLNALIKYKINTLELNDESLTEEVVEQPSTPEVPVLQQDPLESDESFKERVGTVQRTHDWYTEVMNLVNFNDFYPAKKIKSDSEEEFKNYLKNYISNWIVSTPKNSSLTRKHYYYSPSTIGATSSYVTVPLHDITEESLKYLDPKLYNELGLKYFSKHSASKMYKYFKDLVEKQNKEKEKERIALDIDYTKYDPFMNVSVRPFYQEGGIIKANEGAKVPWRRNFNLGAHQMDIIYDTFMKNANSYDAKLIAESLNKLNTDEFSSLNFTQDYNTLGFKNWNNTFNESGLNNLFGYNEDKSDYLGPTTKSRQGFVSYLQNLYDPSNPNKIDSIETGNGSLVFDPNTKLWSYTNWVDPSTKSSKTEPVSAVENSADNNGSTGTPVLPEIKDLTLKDLNIQKPIDWNPHGVWNSLTGYFANEAANAKKREILKEIPLYLEVMAPEKAFKTAYTYDLEQAKNEILAEANNIQPITSDAATYYAAKNDSIKNARAYATKLDTEINNRILQTKDANSDIAYANAVTRTLNVNTNAKYGHDWDIEVNKQGAVDYIEAANQSFLGLNKEFKHYHVTDSTKKQKERDASMYKHLLTGITTSPSNYINGWTKHHDLIWFKGQNGQLETNLELIEYQQLLALVNQVSSTIFDLYNNIEYPGIGQLFTPSSLKEAYNPNKHGNAIVGKKGMKIDKLKIGNYINKLK